ncbi:Indoleamine 2,3-dioxygenase [Parathielavia appendiculata]|uniref:Indoleamine 2,3-dioxygenase n=1 Tax=Parathielavia appendiculata TaxID=2587402 RepID=A0AAN6TT87_9PEZI|nr:Indoleamine 2,3-dioxygenase [Parathielavia appendiculata]
MSPCEILTSAREEEKAGALPLLLDDYAITSNGFLPEEPPLKRLPHPYYSPWETLVECLPTAIAEQTLRQQVDGLPILSTDHLAREQEWRRAYVVLGFLTHGYIWGGDTAAEILPPSITRPLLAVSHHLGIPPVAAYASLNLWNFTSASPANDLSDLDALQALHTFTGTPDESWFYMVSVAMESQGAYIIPVMLTALHTLSTSPPSRISSSSLPTATKALTEMTTCIHKLGNLLDRMDEHCSPQVFYHRIRPFLAGSKNMVAAGLPRGVFYDEGDGRGEWRQLRGGSNGQSSLIQFLDVVLGVEHAAEGNASPDSDSKTNGHDYGRVAGKFPVSFHQEVRGYMPEPHRRFLEDVAARWPGGMRKAVGEVLMAVGGDEKEERFSNEQRALREAFRMATKSLAEFRNKHLQIVARYIVIPSRQLNWSQGVNLATASSRLRATSSAMGRDAMSDGGAELTGTGGTALLPFLKQSRNETFRAGGFHVQ